MHYWYHVIVLNARTKTVVKEANERTVYMRHSSRCSVSFETQYGLFFFFWIFLFEVSERMYFQTTSLNERVHESSNANRTRE
jgi:hypothetical protein